MRRTRDRSPDWRGHCTGWEEQARRMRTTELDAERTDGGQEARTLLGSIRTERVTGPELVVTDGRERVRDSNPCCRRETNQNCSPALGGSRRGRVSEAGDK